MPVPPPDSIGPYHDAVEVAAADWSGGDYNVAAVLGASLARRWEIPVGATGGTLIVSTAAGVERTFNVDPGDAMSLQFKSIMQESTVTAVRVGV